MGIYDRDHFRRPGHETFARVPLMSVTMWLIVLCVAVFLLDQLSGRVRPPEGWIIYTRHGAQVIEMSWVEFWGHFSAYTVIARHEYWRYITFQFLHAGTGHLLFNMIALYLFGPMIEDFFNRKRFTAFYLLCGASGAAVYLILWQLGLLGRVAGVPRGSPEDFSAFVPLVGASAGIFGILIAATRIAPDVKVMLLIPPIPMRLRTLAWVLMAIAVATIFFGWTNAGGEAAHLGGAFMGYALITNPRILNVVEPAWWKQLLSRRR